MPYTHKNTKDYANVGTYQFNKIGEHILVWSQGGKPPEKNKRGVVISAHGGQSATNSTFTVPADTSVLFYCPHGYTLTDPVMIRVARGEIKPNSAPVAAKQVCKDYSLGKYQGKHGGKEDDDYDLIGEKMHPEYLRRLAEEHGIAPEKMNITEILYDVVTIRNRPFKSAPSLSTVIAELRNHNYFYNEIHCSFCRSPSLPWKSSSGDWDVKNN